MNRQPPRRASSRSWTPYALAAVLLAGGGWAYATSLDGGFVFDDFLSVVHNAHVRALWPLASAIAAPADTTLSGRPFASLTFAVNFALAPVDAATGFSRSAWSYHAVNVAIHLAAALALFGVARRTLSSDRLRSRFGTAANGLAFAIALVWVVHPLNTEAVSYVVQRVESLMGLLALLTLYCAIRAPGPGGSAAWTASAVACHLLALGSKESAAVTPLVIAAWDYLFLGSDPGRGWRTDVWRQRWPLYAGFAAASLLLVFTVPGARSRSAGFGLEGWTPWSYLLTQSGVLVHYLRLAAWPSPLILDPYWPAARSIGDVAWSVAALAALFALTVLGMIRRHPAAFVGVCFFVVLAPTSSILPIVTEVAAEHRMYLPLAAIAALLVVGAFHLARQVAARAEGTGGIPRWAVTAAGLALAVVAGALGAQTRARNLDYAGEERIWRDTIAKQPDNARARTALGAELVEAGRYQDAAVELEAALALDPGRAETLSNLGAAEFALGQIDASIAHLERAVALRPEFAAAHRNLAAAYRARRQDALAIRHFRRVLDAEPDHPVVLRDLALLLAVTSDDGARNGAEALRLAERAVALTARRDPAALVAMATALAELDRFDAAVAIVREAGPLAAGNAALDAELSRLLEAYSARQKIRRPAG